MTFRSVLAQALANAFASGAWEAASLRALAADVLGVRHRWVPSVVRAVLETFPAPPEDDEGVLAIAAYIDCHSTFRAAMYASPRPRLRHWLARPPGMGATPWPVPPAVTVVELARLLEVEVSVLEWLADARRYLCRSQSALLSHYHRRWLPKPSGGHRLIETPKPLIKTVQRRVLRRILDAIPAHAAAQGFVRGRSALSHAARHAGSGVVLCLDLEDFFTSIPYGRVLGVFRAAGYPLAVARTLASLCTTAVPLAQLETMPRPALASQVEAHQRLRRNALRQHLPQGAPTSPALANLCAFGLDRRLSGAAAAAGLSYSRYADDLAFSGGADFARGARRFAAFAAGIALDEDFDVNFRKTRVMTRATRQRVCGVVVNARPNVARDDYDRLKAILTNCRRHGAHGQNREGHPDFRAHLRGRVAWVEAIAPKRGARLRALFEAIDWAAPP